MFTLLHRSETIAKPCFEKKNHEHGTISPHIQVSWRPATNRENHHRFCRKSTTSSTDFGERICHLWGYLSQVCEAPFLGRTCSVFGENRLRFWEEQAPFLGQSVSILVKTGTVWWDKLVRFLDWLGQSSSLTVLNAKHVWVWIQGFKGGWVSLKRKSTGGKLEGKWLKPINFDIETVFGFVLGTCMRCHKHKLEIHSSY